MSGDKSRIVVTGASSILGHFLLRRLADAGYEIHAISRTRQVESAVDESIGKITWHMADIAQPGQLPMFDIARWIHLGPLWLLPPLLPILHEQGVTRVICFGSTSMFSKAGSPDAGERETATRLGLAEKAVQDLCSAYGICWTLFRPTMIYDCIRDKNITFIARFISRFGFFPIIGPASGRRQPVHAEDLVAACMAAMENVTTFGKAYNLSGGETLGYREMVARIFAALGKRPRVIRFPFWLFRLAILAISVVPGKRNLTNGMMIRMNLDLCFDHAAATRDFGYDPRPFIPSFHP